VFGTFAYGGAASSQQFIDVPNGTTRATQTPAAGQTHIQATLASLVNPASITGKVFADKQTTSPALAGTATIIRAILRGTGTTVDPYAAY